MSSGIPSLGPGAYHGTGWAIRNAQGADQVAPDGIPLSFAAVPGVGMSNKEQRSSAPHHQTPGASAMFCLSQADRLQSPQQWALGQRSR